MRLTKVKAWRAINKAGQVAEFTTLYAARKWAGTWGIINETFVHRSV